MYAFSKFLFDKTPASEFLQQHAEVNEYFFNIPLSHAQLEFLNFLSDWLYFIQTRSSVPTELISNQEFSISAVISVITLYGLYFNMLTLYGLYFNISNRKSVIVHRKHKRNN